ncbi:MAG: hypothetical protein ACLRNQ_10625 [Flavonifractor plautii]
MARFQTGEELLQYEYGGFGTEVGLLDGGGEELELGDTYLDRSYDWETGVWTVTLSYPDADPAELARAEADSGSGDQTIPSAFWRTRR